MIYANGFGKFAGIFFVVALILFIAFYSFICVKGLIAKIKRNKKLKSDKERLCSKNDKEGKEAIDKDKKQ